VIPAIIIAIAIYAAIRILFHLYRSDGVLSTKNKIFKAASLVLNGIWMVLILPMLPVVIMAGMFSAMSTAENPMHTALVAIGTIMFWATPVLVIASVILSFKLREKQMFATSALLQFIPVVSALIAVAAILVTGA
jgi:hypothetical protein